MPVSICLDVDNWLVYYYGSFIELPTEDFNYSVLPLALNGAQFCPYLVPTYYGEVETESLKSIPSAGVSEVGPELTGGTAQ